MSRVSIPITLLAHGAGLDFPAYASAEAAGCDLMAALPANEPLTLLPGQRCLIPTGLAVALPAGFEGQIRPRSGLALRHGVSVLNAPGTIDADYRGEIQVILVNLGELPFVIERGMRIAQFVLAPVVRAAFTPAISLDATERGEGGFGSTGFHAGGGSKN